MPPRGSSECIRSIKTLKYILRFQWQPVVLTIRSPLKPTDQTLISELPPEVTIIRAYSNKFFDTCMKALSVIIPGLHPHDYYFEWLPFAISSGKKILQKEDIDVILSRSTPIASHIVGLMLKSKSNLPWIADFSDPWTLSPFIPFKIPILYHLEQYLEKRVLIKADKVIVTTERYRDIVIKQFKTIPDIEKKIIAIPNSYDPEDFEGVNPKKTSTENNCMNVTYMGRFYGPRKPDFFLESLGLLKKEFEVLKIRVKIIGGSERDNESFEKLAEQFGVKELIQILPPISHHETFTQLANSDVLLLIDAPSDHESIFLPMKLLEYLAVRKPILALTPMNGESADIIRSTRTGTIVAPTDISGIKNAIGNYYQDYLKSKLTITPDIMEIEKYCIETNVARLVNEIDILTSGAKP